MNEGKCDICTWLHEAKNNHTVLIDGKTKQGPWAFMCESHFNDLGIGLGTGRGQKYEKKGDQWIKITNSH